MMRFSLLELPETQVLRSLTTDARSLFTTRVLRMFAYGFLSVVLVLYFAARGLDEAQIGWLLAITLLGDVILSLGITLLADQIGRQRMLMFGAGLMIFAGFTLGLTESGLLMVVAVLIGTISPSGSEVGPFLSIEQAALTQTISGQTRTSVFAWYNLVGSFATAFGALCAGAVASFLQSDLMRFSLLDSYRVVMLIYGVLGLALLLTFTRLTSEIEVKTTEQPAGLDQQIVRRFGLHRSKGVVARLSALFALDAFAGGLILQSVLAYWFSLRFGVGVDVLGPIFFGANLLAGLSALAAGRLAARIGLINTMVWTHIPSNVLLMLVPLMPTLPLAVILLLIRFSISQMDVPTRQSYVMSVVDPDERSAAAGITTIARTVGAACSPPLTGVLFAAGLFSLPFFAAGLLKIAYDLALYRGFRALKPKE